VTLKTFKQFYYELRRLEAMVAATQYSFDRVRKDLKSQTLKKKPDKNTKIKLLAGKDTLIESSYYGFYNGLKNSYPRYARETIFVRLVSTLEVFLVDVIRDLYLNRLDLFHDQNKRVEITYGELFSYPDISLIRNKAIFKELRQLHSGGLREIAKYYQNRVGINLGSIGVDLGAIWEAVDRRHLLVHALGRADATYRKTYGYTNRATLSVGVDYFFAASREFRRLAEAIEPTVTKLIEDATDDVPKLEKAMSATLQLTHLNLEAKRMTRPDFAFVLSDSVDGEKIVRLRDFLVDSLPIEDGLEIRLKGDANAVTGYMKLVKSQRKAGGLRIKAAHRKRERGLETKALASETMIEAVRDRLPDKPWPIGVHKLIASELGISNSLCSRIIDVILAETA
jgi:hypothetical protein